MPWLDDAFRLIAIALQLCQQVKDKVCSCKLTGNVCYKACQSRDSLSRQRCAIEWIWEEIVMQLFAHNQLNIFRHRGPYRK